MDERDQDAKEVTAKDNRDKDDLPHVSQHDSRDVDDPRKPRPQYDSFMRVIRR